MQHKFYCINFISRSWRRWQNDQITPNTYLYDNNHKSSMVVKQQWSQTMIKANSYGIPVLSYSRSIHAVSTIGSMIVGTFHFTHGLKSLSPKYDMDTYMTTLFGKDTRGKRVQMNLAHRWWQPVRPLPFWLVPRFPLPLRLHFWYMSAPARVYLDSRGDGCNANRSGWLPPFWWPLGCTFGFLGGVFCKGLPAGFLRVAENGLHKILSLVATRRGSTSTEAWYRLHPFPLRLWVISGHFHVWV
jgi:hypothetical protein